MLTNLPPVASLDLYYTASTTNLSYGGTYPVSNGALNATIPADCIFVLIGSAPLPVLTISAVTDGIAISWPAPLTNYVLEIGTNLGPAITWSAVANPSQPAGEVQTVTLPLASGRQLFRLRQQAQ